MSGIKLKAKAKDGVVEVKALMNHPMETGQRKDSKTGEKIPAHFIKQVEVSVNGREVMKAYWGPSVSKNPYIAFECAGSTGDTITLSWVDNKDEKDSIEDKIG
ncbi:MAG TPA: thiosulfate oxidation carrier complex protein SoxZ [Thiolinea sp.]|nr:thiosulfate oxidation carrier complex protein SoxZ [Thiolinea sp.]